MQIFNAVHEVKKKFDEDDNDDHEVKKKFD